MTKSTSSSSHLPSSLLLKDKSVLTLRRESRIHRAAQRVATFSTSSSLYWSPGWPGLVYSVPTGKLYYYGEFVAQGYAGRLEGRNNVEMQSVRNVGPIPIGNWRVSGWGNSKGPLTARLTPAKETETYGRSGFLIHGDNVKGDASQGCIVLPRAGRAFIHNIGNAHPTIAVVDF